MRMMLLTAAMLAVPLSGAFAQAPISSPMSFGSSASVISLTPAKYRPTLGDHLGGLVRVRNNYDDHGLNNELLSIMFNEHSGGH
jgi:hypothetical protein